MAHVDLRDDAPGTTVLLDGHPQSYVNLDDPGDLGFEYLEQMAVVLDTLPGRPPPDRQAVTHVGGAGLTLARYVAATRPGSPQVVLEPDEALTALVRRELPLPRGHRIRVRPVDGRTGLGALAAASADLVVVDAFDRGRVPGELTTAAAFALLAQVLRPGGTALVNLADEPGMRYAARVAATARSVLAHLALIGTHEVLNRRRFGNVVLLGSDRSLDTVGIGTALARRALGAGLWDEAQTARWARSARPLLDDDPQDSPTPPDPGRWRIR